MPFQYAKYIRRPFQGLFSSMEHHYKQACVLYEKLHAQDFSDPLKFDQDLWNSEKAAARSSFIMVMAAIEAFVNNVYSDFGSRKKEDLSVTLLNESQKKRSFEFWKLQDKVYFLPTMCNTLLNPPAFYFKRDSNDFKLFEELVEIRNSIMHGRPYPFLIRIELKPNKIHELYDGFPENFWPISKIPKDFTSFNFDCTKTACNNILWLKNSLTEFLDKVNEKYFIEEKIELKGPVLENGTD